MVASLDDHVCGFSSEKPSKSILLNCVRLEMMKSSKLLVDWEILAIFEVCRVETDFV